MPQVEASLRRSFEFAATVCAGIGVGVGICGLVPWIFAPHPVSMSAAVRMPSAASAIALVLTGTAAWLLRRPGPAPASERERQVVIGLAWATLLLGFIAVLEHVSGVQWGVESLISKLSPPASFLSAACMVLLGFALLAAASRNVKVNPAAQGAALACIPLPLMGLLDYLVIPPVATTGMSLVSAFGYLAVALAIVFVQPERGVMKLITANRPAGQILRRLLPMCIALPFIVSALRHVGELAGLYGRSEGALVAAVIFIVVMAIIIYWFAVSLDVMDARRHVAEDSLRTAIQDLERRNTEMVAANRSLAELYQRSHRLEVSLRELSGRLLRMQDEERRRLARELHDSAGQILAAVAMNLSTVQEQAAGLPLSAQRALTESAEMLESATREIRTMSYLLHPPLLDEAGLAAALKWFVEGFEERSNIDVTLELPRNEIRLPQEVETTVFRIVQESLTNVHRHSGSPTALIRLMRDAESLTLEVADRGRGIPEEVLRRSDERGRLGVGILGMRERVMQLGGTLDIVSSGSGTTVRAVLPAKSASSSFTAELRTRAASD